MFVGSLTISDPIRQTSVPETKASSLAVADYASPAGAGSGARAYLVAFAP